MKFWITITKLSHPEMKDSITMANLLLKQLNVNHSVIADNHLI